MAENSQESQELEGGPGTEATPKEGDRQSLLLQLAERTVLQAEALAQEITDRARQDAEAEGAKLLEQYTDKAKVEAQRAIDVAQRRSTTIINEANAQALADSEKTLSKARSQSETMLSEARSESEKILGNARSEGEESLGKTQREVRELLGGAQGAQNEAQEVLGRARQEALAITNASQSRADSVESNAKLGAEFIIRQTTQKVADGIRTAILEISNDLLPGLNEYGNAPPEPPVTTDQVEHTAAAVTEAAGNAASNQTAESSSPGVSDASVQSSDTPAGRRTRSSTRNQGRT